MTETATLLASLPLDLAIIATHELGHYAVARALRLPASLHVRLVRGVWPTPVVRAPRSRLVALGGPVASAAVGMGLLEAPLLVTRSAGMCSLALALISLLPWGRLDGKMIWR